MLNTGPSVISFTATISFTSASDFKSHVARSLMGKLHGYGAVMLDGALHGARMTPVGLHDSAISGHVALVGMRAMFRTSASDSLWITTGCLTGRGGTTGCGGSTGRGGATGRACRTGLTLRLWLRQALRLRLRLL